MQLHLIEDAIHKLLHENLIERPEWLSPFTQRYFVTIKGFEWLREYGHLPRKSTRKPELTAEWKRRAGMW